MAGFFTTSTERQADGGTLFRRWRDVWRNLVPMDVTHVYSLRFETPRSLAAQLLTKRKDLAEDPDSYDDQEYDELYRNVKRAQGIDRVARVVFPCAFLIFNIVCWSMYGSQVYLSVYGELIRVY